MEKHTKVVTFLLTLTLVMILPWSQTYAEEKDSGSASLVRSNIVGKVVDAQGNPIEKVKVTVLDPDNQEIVARGITNDKGDYVIECLDPREYHLALSALPEQFLGQTVVVKLGADGQVVHWVAKTETPAIATTRVGGGVCGCGTAWLSKKDDDNRRTVTRSNIIGKVVDAQGNPMTQVKVTVFDPDNQEIIARRITDEKGNYAIECLDQQKYNLVLGALPERFLAQSAMVELGKDGLDVQWAANREIPDIDTAKMDGGVCSCAAGLSRGGEGIVAAAGATPTLLSAGTVGTVGAVGVVVGGGVSLGVLLSGGSEDSGGPPSPPSPASPSR